MKQSLQNGITLVIIIVVLFSGVLYYKYSSSTHTILEGRKLGHNQHARWSPLHTLLNASVVPKHSLPTHMEWKSKGAVFSLSFYDQLTSALRRVVSLSCWAREMNMEVVEPFLNQAHLTGPVHPVISKNVRFQDLINISVWNRKLAESNFSPLISWEKFVVNASRNVILVEIIYNNKKGFPSECRFRSLHKFWSNWLAPYHFRIHDKVCLNFKEHKLLSTTKEFNSMVFSTQNASLDSNVTVIFNEWRGIVSTESHFIPIKNNTCNNHCHEFVKSAFVPSLHLLAQVDSYIKKYLRSDLNFIAIMIRWQLMLKKSKDLNFAQCVNSIEKTVSSFNVQVVFMAFDVGRYGSGAFYASTYHTQLINVSEGLLQKFAHGHVLSFSEYEDRFTNIADIDNPAYISLLQKYIAAKAKCLLLVGGGYFQDHAAHIWRKYHPKQGCLKIMKHC